MKMKMQNPIAPVSSGAATQEIKIFFVSSQFTESMPLAAMENPIMHPMACVVCRVSVQYDRLKGEGTSMYEM